MKNRHPEKINNPNNPIKRKPDITKAINILARSKEGR